MNTITIPEPTKTTDDNRDEREGELDDLNVEVRFQEIMDDLDNAQSCEACVDFDANLNTAIESLTRLIADLAAIRSDD